MGIRAAHWDDWSLEGLLEAKGELGQRVSLVVPARNEAATVGDVVTRVREALMETVDLVDEIVVIDSDSVDDTFAVAESAGARVHRAAEIRPDLGSHPGKGEAMWKSLFVTTGDLVVFMDADLREWDTHFVPGLLGPLLTDPAVQLVKGFYERPGEQGPLDGGRVTELVARPLIALHFPDLVDLVQPLAGEWAVRRQHFASLAVPTGYAVELAALVDTAARHGAGAIGQVDLGVRSHGHQALLDLGAMAVQILEAGLRRVPGAGGEEGLRGSRDGRGATSSTNEKGWEGGLRGSRDGRGATSSTNDEVTVLRQFLPGPVPVDRVVETRERPPAERYL